MHNPTTPSIPEAIGVRPTMNTASQKARFTQRTLMAIMTEQADLADIPGRAFKQSANNEGLTAWISYPAARAAIEENIRVLVRSLADAHGIPESYPPMG
jgi:hypothetical protein